nr:MAG TPA: hypothetical protein [Caudoviricetes sp.]
MLICCPEEATETAKITLQKTLKPLRTKEKPAISADCWLSFIGGAEGNRTPLL